MTRRKIEEQSIRNLQRSKRSYYIRLPIELVRLFRWKDGQKLVVKQRGKGKMTIEDWKE